MASQILLTAVLRFSNRNTCFASGSLFHISTRRVPGQPVMSRASSFLSANFHPSFGTWTGFLTVWAVTRFSASNSCLPSFSGIASVRVHSSLRPLCESSTFLQRYEEKSRAVWSKDCQSGWCLLLKTRTGSVSWPTLPEIRPAERVPEKRYRTCLTKLER